MKKHTSLDQHPLLARIITTSAMVLIFIIGTCAFTLSFKAQLDLAHQCGYNLSALFPVIIDATILLLSLLAVLNRMAGRRYRHYFFHVIWTTALSTWFNIQFSPEQYVDNQSDKILVRLVGEYNWIVIVVAHAVPPLFFLMTIENGLKSLPILLIRFTTNGSSKVEQEEQKEQNTDDPPSGDNGSKPPVGPVDPDDSDDDTTTNGLPTDVPNPLDESANPQRQLAKSERQREVAELLPECDTPKEVFEILREKYDVSLRTIQRDIDDIRRRELVQGLSEAGLEAPQILEKIQDTFPSLTLEIVEKDIIALNANHHGSQV